MLVVALTDAKGRVGFDTSVSNVDLGEKNEGFQLGTKCGALVD